MTIGNQFDSFGKTLSEYWSESQKSEKKVNTQACHCVGPQDGNPLCPCQMRGVTEKDGRWVRPEQDLGPVRRKE